MSSTPIRMAMSFLGRWLAIAALVAFLTFTFSFLGTILCAVVIGMMMGGTKHARWQTVPVALVFPATVYAMLRSSNTELVRGQVNGLSWLCFGAFWLSYLMTSLVMVAEKKGTQAGRQGAGNAASAAPLPLTSPARDAAVEGGHNGAQEKVVELTLGILQGLWGRESDGKGTDIELSKTRLEINQDHLVIKGLDTEGHVRWVAEGDLKVEQNGEGRGIRLSKATRIEDSTVGI